MKGQIILRLIASVLITLLILALIAFNRRANQKRGSWYQPTFCKSYFAVFLIYMPLMMLIFPRRFLQFLNLGFGAWLSLFAAMLLLLLLTPLLRKRFSARDCAELWLLPSILAIFSRYFWRTPFEPFVEIHLTQTVLTFLFALWGVGFSTVLGWKLISHFRFRHSVLRNAVPASDQECHLFREVWESLDRSDKLIGYRLRLVRSPAAACPFSIGLFARSTCLVLPLRDYTEEELRLIFRHESLHLIHQDNGTKFSIALVCAAGWFLPCLWIGMRRASEDLELRCDEEATTGMDDTERREYAVLLLQNAGTAKGFTTCLSATASGLRYRLGRVLHPETRGGGLAVLGLLTALFIFSAWTVGFVLDVGTIQTKFFGRDDGWHITAINPYGDGGPCKNPEAVERYLSDLQLTQLSRTPASYYIGGSVVVSLEKEDSETENEKTVYLIFQPEGDIVLYDDPNDRSANCYYRLDKTVDLNWLRSMAEATGGG